jgi:hypothetical protein
MISDDSTTTTTNSTGRPSAEERKRLLKDAERKFAERMKNYQPTQEELQIRRKAQTYSNVLGFVGAFAGYFVYRRTKKVVPTVLAGMFGSSLGVSLGMVFGVREFLKLKDKSPFLRELENMKRISKGEKPLTGSEDNTEQLESRPFNDFVPDDVVDQQEDENASRSSSLQFTQPKVQPANSYGSSWNGIRKEYQNENVSSWQKYRSGNAAPVRTDTKESGNGDMEDDNTREEDPFAIPNGDDDDTN